LAFVFLPAVVAFDFPAGVLLTAFPAENYRIADFEVQMLSVFGAT
jgi:hypothetical protein